MNPAQPIGYNTYKNRDIYPMRSVRDVDKVCLMSKAINSELRREHQRIPAALPVHVADQMGTTRDVSVGGIYFELETTTSIGSEISFEIDIASPKGPMKFKCNGLVVRAEQKNGRTGIAVKIAESRLEIVQ
jgi:hypothetical protein